MLIRSICAIKDLQGGRYKLTQTNFNFSSRTRSTSTPTSLRPNSFAEWAEFIGWRDADIVHQLNGGGLRTYHESLSLDTVLAFHHGSLLENFPAADKVTTADQEKGWISAAAKGHHLPVIPARVIPRGVALQPRYRKEKE